MATKLEDLEITSTDLVDQGANPDARIRLFKKKSKSGKIKRLIGKLSGKTQTESAKSDVVKEPEDNIYTSEDDEVNKIKSNKEDFSMDKSKMTADDIAILEGLEKKYDTSKSGDGNNTPPALISAEIPELHPEVKKALEENQKLAAQVAELTKNLEIQGLIGVAKKYEIIGKKPEELAVKLYNLKKAEGTAYEDYVSLLDEQITLVEKSGLFNEIGSNRSGSIGGDDEIMMKAAEIRKSQPNLSQADAIAKAFEENPELAAQYENNYQNT
ncbi:MAG: hypothetical protein FWD01_04360 [Defluviitaleaceae bacterium]|nr:hypothetical protein [Defluviitaleaceae bacterium]